MHRVIFLTSLLIVFISCNTSIKKSLRVEKYLHEERVLDSSTNRLVIPKYHKDSQIWIKDSLIIEEVMGMNLSTNEFGVKTIEIYPERYTFINMRNKSIYEFSNFSDTAKLIDCYTEKNSKGKFNWLFYKYSDSVNFNEISKLTDTVIDNKNYSRFIISNSQIQNKKLDYTILTRYYTDCNEKDIFLTLHKRISENTKCAVLQSDVIYVDAKIFYHHNLVKKATTLSSEELKVFDAWEKYSHTHPVEN